MSNLITNARPRNQASYGRFQPRADQKKYGVIYAALEGATGFPHVNEVMDEGVPIGHNSGALRYEPYKDGSGNYHDVTLPNGQKVREMICPIEDVREKERREGAESTEYVNNYEQQKGVKSRFSDDGRVHLSSEITERSTAQTFTPHDEETKNRMTVAMSTPAAARSGWTPERRAAQTASLAKARAAKQAKTQPATT